MSEEKHSFPRESSFRLFVDVLDQGAEGFTAIVGRVDLPHDEYRLYEYTENEREVVEITAFDRKAVLAAAGEVIGRLA